MYPYIITQKGVNVYIDNSPCYCDVTDANYESVISAIKSNDDNEVKLFLSKREAFKSFVEGSMLTIDDKDCIYYKSDVVPFYVAQAALAMRRDGFDISPLINFIEKLMQNPVKTAIEELYQFMEVANLPITPEGNFLAYKVVRDDYKDIHSGTFDNSVGKICEEDPSKCDTNRNNTCSKGLHFCSKSYLNSFGDKTSRLMVVEISPTDVVSIPKDYNLSKGRCWKYKVVAEINNGRSDTTKTKEFEATPVRNFDVTPHEEVSVAKGLKKCSKCSTIKPLDDFYNDSKSKSGKKSQCKVCSKAAKNA